METVVGGGVVVCASVDAASASTAIETAMQIVENIFRYWRESELLNVIKLDQHHDLIYQLESYCKLFLSCQRSGTQVP